MLTEDQYCFYCDHFYHEDPDTDCCALDEHEVTVFTPKCDNFKKYEKRQ